MARKQQGLTPIAYAVALHNPVALERLIEHGANPNIIDDVCTHKNACLHDLFLPPTPAHMQVGENILAHAIKKGLVDCVQLLLRANPDLTIKDPVCLRYFCTNTQPALRYRQCRRD